MFEDESAPWDGESVVQINGVIVGRESLERWIARRVASNNIDARVDGGARLVGLRWFQWHVVVGFVLVTATALLVFVSTKQQNNQHDRSSCSNG